MRAIIVTDCHHDGNGKVPETLASIIRKTIHKKSDIPVDALFDLGDRTTRLDAASDKRNMMELAAVFKTANVKRVHIPGNYDVENLSLADNEEIMGVPMKTSVMEFPDVSVVSWIANVLGEKRGADIYATKEDIESLRSALAAAQNRTVLVLSHLSLGHKPEEIIGRNPYCFFYKNHEEIWRVLYESGKKILSFSGHMHRLRLGFEKSEWAMTMPDLTSLHPPLGNPLKPPVRTRITGAFTDLVVSNGFISLDIQSRVPADRMIFRYNLQSIGKWQAPGAEI